MTVAYEHIEYHQHVRSLYEELFAVVSGIKVHSQPALQYNSNYWISIITLNKNLKVKGQEKVYNTMVTGAMGGKFMEEIRV